MPIHLRVLLDRGRKEVLKLLGFESWDEFQAGQNVQQLIKMIMPALADVDIMHCPP